MLSDGGTFWHPSLRSETYPRAAGRFRWFTTRPRRYWRFQRRNVDLCSWRYWMVFSPKGRQNPPIYVGVKGRIYDVSYGGTEHYGPGAGYHVFAGLDASGSSRHELLSSYRFTIILIFCVSLQLLTISDASGAGQNVLRTSSPGKPRPHIPNREWKEGVRRLGDQAREQVSCRGRVNLTFTVFFSKDIKFLFT